MSRSIKGLKWVNNGIVAKRIQPEQINEYLNNGWKLGNLPSTSNYVWVHKDGKNSTISKDKLDEYLNNGWVRGKLSSHKELNSICVNKDGKTIHIQKEELENYIKDGWSRGVSFHNRWITNDIQERWTSDPLPEGWYEGRLIDNPKQIIDIYNDYEVIQIERRDLHKYEKLGYTLGKGKKVGLYEGSTKNTVWMNNGIEQFCVKKDKVEEYLKLGYVKGNISFKNKILVNKDGKQHYIHLSDLDNYLEDGYSIGNIYSNHMKNKKWVQKDDKYKAVTENDYDNYIKDGWIPGRPVKAADGKIWVYKDDETTYIDPEQLISYIENGWHSGRIANSTICITNGKEDKTISLDDYNLNYKNSIEWRIGTKDHGCSSTVENNFKQLLDDNNINYNSHFYLNNNGKKYFYDFKVDNILIELNPFATHNSNWSPYNNPLSTDYHYNKTKAAVENGYRCINIWDWDSIDILLNLLKPRQKIYARKCEIKEVDIKNAKKFLNNNHFQKYAKDSIRLGLYYNNELVSIMTFAKPRYSKKYDYEIIRYCSIYDITGGSEKLFKYFLDTYNPKSIVSYCDLSKFTGSTYEKLGFTKFNISISKHWYNPKYKKHITDNLLRQLGFDKLVGDIFGTYGKGTNNEELMLQHGFVEIYDCGQVTYIYENIT